MTIFYYFNPFWTILNYFWKGNLSKITSNFKIIAKALTGAGQIWVPVQHIYTSFTYIYTYIQVYISNVHKFQGVQPATTHGDHFQTKVFLEFKSCSILYALNCNKGISWSNFVEQVNLNPRYLYTDTSRPFLHSSNCEPYFVEIANITFWAILVHQICFRVHQYWHVSESGT